MEDEDGHSMDIDRDATPTPPLEKHSIKTVEDCAKEIVQLKRYVESLHQHVNFLSNRLPLVMQHEFETTAKKTKFSDE